MACDPGELLFEYLRDIIYTEDAGELDISQLPENLRDLGEGMRLLAEWISQVKRIGSNLSNGNLNFQPPDKDNILADPLKALQSSMKHITWKAKRISEGDYSQKVDFMGEFSEAFNIMTRQLADRKERLEQSRDDAVRTKLLFQSVTDNLESYVMIFAKKDNAILYKNRSFCCLYNEEPRLAENLKEKLQEKMQQDTNLEGKWELQLYETGEEIRYKKNWYFHIETTRIVWDDQPASAHIIEDISEKKQHEMEMEGLAFYDSLTGLYNRYYIMHLLDQWIMDQEYFSLTFIDLDNLKYVNDQLGHLEGDGYIRKAAEVLEELPMDSVVARIGGDEFLVLAKNCNEMQLSEKLEEKRKCLLQWSKDKGLSYGTTFSYGVVNVESIAEKHRSLLLREADKRMYQYKMANKPKIEI